MSGKKTHNTQQTQNEQKKTNLPPCYCVSFDRAFFMSFVSLCILLARATIRPNSFTFTCTLMWALCTHMPFHSIPLDQIRLDWIELDFGLDWIGLSERTRLCRDVIRYQQCLQFAVYDNLSCTAKAPGDIIFGFFEISDEFDSNLLIFFNNFRLIQIKIPFFTFLHFYPFIFTHRHRFVAKIKLNEQCWHMSNPAQVHWKHLNRSEHTHITSPTS